MNLQPELSTSRRRAFLAAALGLCLTACNGSAPDDVFDDSGTTGALVFVKAERAETLNEGGIVSNLYVLAPVSPNGRVRNLTNMEDASISDPCVSFDGRKVLFSMNPAGSDPRNIYEIGIDGTGLRQITSGGGDDFDPIYLADDRILFTSNRDGERDEYNSASKEVLYTCNADGSNVRRVSFNLSDDFDPFLLSTGRVAYTRWEHHGTANRFPLSQVNPDGTSFFLLYGPHDRNVFHGQETRDGRYIGINSTRVNGDAGQVVLMSIASGDPEQHTDANYANLTPDITLDGPPYPTGAFKHPNVLPDRDGKRQYVVSYTLPAATDDEVDFGLYSFAVGRDAGDREEMQDLTLLWNDPATDELDAQLVAPRARPPLLPSTVDENLDWGTFVGEDIYARGFDGQERPERGSVSQVMIVEGVPTTEGMGAMEVSATEFERKRIIGFAPVESDGSFAIRVPADTPISVHTLDELGRSRVFQRTWVYVRPGERRTFCAGCHAPRDGSVPSNQNPLAANITPHDLVVPVAQRQVVNFRDTVAPIIAAKCVSCHQPTISSAPPDTIPAPAGLDLRLDVDPESEEGFPIAYLSLVGEEMMGQSPFVTVPASRQSPLVDVIMGIGASQGLTPHPGELDSTLQLTPAEMTSFFRWIDLGGQYR
jgi:cytochrome c553